MAKKDKPVIKQISWATNNNTLIWELINEIENTQNFKTLYGTQKGEVCNFYLRRTQLILHAHKNSSGDTKIKVYKRIGQKILPDLYALDEDTVASRVKGKIEECVKLDSHLLVVYDMLTCC